ncbi:MAG: hypothetical protein R3346_04265 [Candidatus Spechtbacterales bacterium]|nr:hypothetical protein [Candidatus Spechtbacterales bacterium]
MKREKEEIESLRQTIETEMQRTKSDLGGVEPEGIGVSFHRYSEDGIDRMKDSILGYVLDEFRTSGWVNIEQEYDPDAGPAGGVVRLWFS